MDSSSPVSTTFLNMDLTPNRSRGRGRSRATNQGSWFIKMFFNLYSTSFLRSFLTVCLCLIHRTHWEEEKTLLKNPVCNICRVQSVQRRKRRQHISFSYAVNTVSTNEEKEDFSWIRGKNPAQVWGVSNCNTSSNQQEKHNWGFTGNYLLYLLGSNWSEVDFSLI